MTGVFVSKPFQNLAKAGGKDGALNNHDGNKYHKDAMERATTFMDLADEPTKTVPYLISQKKQELYNRNFKALQCIVECVLLCGKQNLALRGQRDDRKSEVSNKGNFLAILKLVAAHDKVLQEHLKNASKNATGTSKRVQNELINIIGTHIRSQLFQTLRQDKAVFSIIADEVTDKYANQEVLTLCLRFVEMDDGDGLPHIQEHFLDFVYLERTTGAKIGAAIMQSLKKHGIDIKKTRGQAYDGASAMSSPEVGAQAVIRAAAPKALYVHCSSHRLNLSIAEACKVIEIRNMIDVLNSVFLFFDLSPKRQKFFNRVLKAYACSSRVQTLKGLCKTRWVESTYVL